MKEIKDLTQGDLFHLANLATGGYFNSQWSKGKSEVEVGGYGKRRRIQWTMNTDGVDELNYFEISSEISDGWNWHCKAFSDTLEQWLPCNTIAPHKLVDYLRMNSFDIENQAKITTWLWQHLYNENLYYLTQHHPEEGVVGEHFFEKRSELESFITTNKIKIDNE